MTIVRWGLTSLLVSALVLGWSVWLLPQGMPRHVGATLAVLLWLFILWFFRNPRRQPKGGPRTLISSADGVVADITEVDEPEFIGGKAVRIGIFLSVFDVHVNRAPCPATVRYARYQPGRFLDARHPDATHHNESNTLGLEADSSVDTGLRLLLRQISGYIARRIVCVHGVGDPLTRGELFGMIRFGSRTELYVPLSHPHDLLVQVGDRVRCGETALVEMTGEVA